MLRNNVRVYTHIQVCIWDPVNGKQLGKSLTGHRQWITWLSWKPFHQWDVTNVHVDFISMFDHLYNIWYSIPYCLKLWPVSFKCWVSFSDCSIECNKIRNKMHSIVLTCHQFPSEFIASITDYKQHLNLLLINAFLV